VMDDALTELYRELIVDHSRHPRNFGRLDDANREAHGHNPLCGDDITVTARVAEDGTIEDLEFQGQGCAVSTASASVMTDALKGRSADEIDALYEAFHSLVTGHGVPDGAPELGKLEAFGGVAAFPMRVKCATLPWHTLRAALDPSRAGTNEAVSTEGE